MKSVSKSFAIDWSFNGHRMRDRFIQMAFRPFDANYNIAITLNDKSLYFIIDLKDQTLQ